MAVTFIRTLIIIITLMVLMRLMGKREIGEMQPYEFIITLIIADLACIPMTEVSIPLSYGIVAILCVFLLHQLLTILEQSGSFVRRIISGKPSLVINKDGVDIKELKRNNLGVSDLIESMRIMGYFSLDDLSYAIYEANGSLSALENQNKKQTSSLPIILVNDKKIDNHNLKLLGLEKSELFAFLTKNNLVLKKVEVLTVDGSGRVYLKEKGKKYRIEQMQLKGATLW